ncbi:hypothetical protein RB653_002257 [Dictyostelium firmibasis]|uniref:LysM domain-containing protein n=1 Tax=Dictyostelium firmibasis TaxID=79012 RepID=A0AAN7TWX2_9MYCE
MNHKKLFNIAFIFFLIIILCISNSNSFVSNTSDSATIFVSNLNPKTYNGTNCGEYNTPCINLNDAFEKLKNEIKLNQNYSKVEIEIINNKENNKEYKPSKLEIFNENLSFSINGGSTDSTVIDMTEFEDSFINIVLPTIKNNNNFYYYNFTNLTFKRNINSSSKIRPTLFNIVNIKNLIFNNIDIILLNNSHVNNENNYNNDNNENNDNNQNNKSIIQETAFFNFTNSNIQFSDCYIPSNKPIIGSNSTIEINYSYFTLDPLNLNSCYLCQYKINKSNDINGNNNNNNNKHNNTENRENLIILTITISFSVIIIITATYKLYNKYGLYKAANLSKPKDTTTPSTTTTTETTTNGGIGGINLLKNLISKKKNSDYIKLEVIKSGDTITSINSE